MASIRRCHRRDRGSIPRQEALFAYFVVLVFVVIVLFTLLPPSYPSWTRGRDRAACCAPRRVVAVSAVRFVGVRPPLFRRSPSARSVPHRLRPRALLSVPPDERPSARVLRCLASRRCARVRTERGGAGGGSAVGGSCPPAWLGLVARRPGVRVRSGPSLMRVPPRALPGGRPPRPREKKRKGAGVRDRDSPDRKAFSPWHVAPPSPSEPARRFSLSFAYLQSRPSCARRSLTGGLCYRKISVPCAFRSCLLWLGDRRCIQSDCLFVQSSCARGRPGHRRETHFPLFLSLGSPLARPDADRPATTARRRIAKLQKIADGHAADSSARHRVAVGDLPTSNVSALRLVLQTLRSRRHPL